MWWNHIFACIKYTDINDINPFTRISESILWIFQCLQIGTYSATSLPIQAEAPKPPLKIVALILSRAFTENYRAESFAHFVFFSLSQNPEYNKALSNQIEWYLYSFARMFANWIRAPNCKHSTKCCLLFANWQQKNAYFVVWNSMNHLYWSPFRPNNRDTSQSSSTNAFMVGYCVCIYNVEREKKKIC